MKIIIQISKLSMLLAVYLFTVSGDVWANKKEAQIINKTVMAYGGDKLLGLKSLILEEKYKTFRYGQSVSPNEVDILDYHSSVSVDFDAQRKNLRLVRGSKEDFSTTHQIFDGKKAYSIDHSARTISENSALNYANVDRHHLQYLDTALVFLMYEARQQASYEGEDNIKGVVHDKVRFKAEGHPEMTLYIDRDTGRVSRMQKDHWRPGVLYNYNYSSYEQKQGILYSTSTYVTRGGRPLDVSVSRKLEFNPDISKQFALPVGYDKEAAMLDFSEMTVKKIADNTYLAGKDWGFSIFVDVGSYFVASGGYEGLTERFRAVKDFSGLDKPLKYQVVSHHHLDHLDGMKEAEALGATFITVKEHVESIRQTAGVDIPDSRFLIINNVGSFADGMLKVIDYPNGHSSHNLMSYFPSGKILFSADFYLSRQEKGAPDGYEELKAFKLKLKEYDLDVKYFAASHSGRVLTSADFDTSIGRVTESVCPPDWAICK